MKYVMFTHGKSGVRVPVLCADFTTHADLRAGDGWWPTSAGFVSFKVDGGLQTLGESTSLKLKPSDGDAALIEVVLAGAEAMLIVVQDTDANKLELIELMQVNPYVRNFHRPKGPEDCAKPSENNLK